MPTPTEIFAGLTRPQSQISSKSKDNVVLLYQHTSTHNHVNEARKQSFTHNRMQKYTPTSNALKQHVKRQKGQ